MMKDQVPNGSQTLADLIGSRLCHDIANPLGAIGNGFELLEMTGSVKGPEMDLIRDAVADAQARLRFLRIAFGAAGPQQIISAREAQEAALAPYRQTRIVPNWGVTQDMPRMQIKLAYLMILCAETAMPMGGTLDVALNGSGRWQLSVAAPRISLDEALWSTLRFGLGAAGRPLRAAEAQFAALHACAESLDVTMNFVGRGDGLSMSTA